MQPLKILAFVIVALPIAAFLLTLFLTEGAPLKPLTPGEESGPAVATRALPRTKLERQGSVAAAGHRSGDTDNAGDSSAGDVFAPDVDAEPAPMVYRDREAQIFFMLFGAPHPTPAPAR
jgi:hypothetical protein